MASVQLAALAYPIDDNGLWCLSCTDQTITECRNVWFAFIRPNKVSASDPCPHCGQPYGAQASQNAAERITRTITAPAKDSQ